ncbi:MAG: cyclase family protein, partial [Nevskiales bacterium]|nr:cyclase family protein [Nevskiales bacterium]
MEALTTKSSGKPRHRRHGYSPLILSLACIVATGVAGAQECLLATPGGNDLAAGASNRITTCEVLRAIRLVRQGRIASLGRVYSDANNSLDGTITPLLHNRTYSLQTIPFLNGLGTNQGIFHDDQIEGNLAQIGTQFDGLRHAGTLGDTDGQDWYNGLQPDQLGVENVRPIFTRGILIDVAGFKGRMLEAGEEITLADVQGALQRQGLSPQ